MGFFSVKGEHHGSECRDRHGTWWVKPNPMGWGTNEARTVKRADAPAREQNNRPAEHGSKAGKALMSGRGALIRWSGDHVQVSGEKPGRQRRRLWDRQTACSAPSGRWRRWCALIRR
jgi:hypothetical protein